ncbi:DUF6600 domain-containing protein [Stenotrophobium rhamnosiphilum]|uniref:FecR protein domain-containing protein n=1 Tax=Stenotrophobium rhamnosiphilum TaxID=2029166 RepID=A0A2T5MHZ7_9GAMM|nr:DUF6600 domain-containing protein [Stenotrophobium rhamnosiphilum]PTU32195.1 hypothetical protein CJD38_05915 [Stenotrophobium rhamnosiphilum]
MDSQQSLIFSSAKRGTAFLRYALVAITVLITGGASAQDEDDPPSRIARLAAISGDVTFAPAGDDDWNQASINRPLTTGDRLLTNDGGRAAMDIDGGDLRIASNTGFNFLNLDDRGTQIELSRGTLNWRVDTIREGQNNEVDTPTVAFVITQPGTYKIVVADDGSSTTVSILQNGAGTVYGERGTSYPISGRQAWRFTDSELNNIAGMPLAAADTFDLWCNDRDSRASNVAANTTYVSPDVVGYNDLASNGTWTTVTEYGNVWYPSAVAVDWAPYRYGHWAYVAPWGWTWIDDASWGFAPFHYGRWVNVSNRWGWVPGPRHVRPVYCPATVAFVGGNGWGVSVTAGRPIAWVPLGPRDVYVPWYRGSQRYFSNVNIRNVTNINHVQVTNVYNDYRGGRANNTRYMNQSVRGGTTVVTRDTFSHGRPVSGAQVRVDQKQWERAPSAQRNDLPSGRPALGLRASSGSARPPSQEFTRPPVSFRKPPQSSLGARNNPQHSQPSLGLGRVTPADRDNDRRNNVTNNRPAERNDNNRREDDPRWNRDAQRNDGDGRIERMPSSRFSPWGNKRGDESPRTQQQGATTQPAQQETPQRRENDSRWNRSEQRNDDRQDRGDNTVYMAKPAPAPEQPQVNERRDEGSRWNNHTRRDSDSNNNAPTPPPVQQQPEQRQEQQRHFGNRGGAENTQRRELLNIPQPTPREQPQRGAEQRTSPFQRPAFENRGQTQNRPAPQPQRPAPERREREPAERPG